MTQYTEMTILHDWKKFRRSPYRRGRRSKAVITNEFRVIIRKTLGFQAQTYMDFLNNDKYGWWCRDLCRDTGWFGPKYRFVIKDPAKAMLFKLSLDALDSQSV